MVPHLMKHEWLRLATKTDHYRYLLIITDQANYVLSA